MMVPASPETRPDDDTEFDLDVRLQAVPRHASADPAMNPSDDCPAGTPSMYGCTGDC
jgi:hypothetical protein